MAQAAGAGRTMQLDVSDLPPGGWLHRAADGLAIACRRLDKGQLQAVHALDKRKLRDPVPSARRIVAGDIVVAVEYCTHAGCRPLIDGEADRGWHCLCHGSQFDPVGRVVSGPAPRNLAMPQVVKVDPGRSITIIMPDAAKVRDL